MEFSRKIVLGIIILFLFGAGFIIYNLLKAEKPVSNNILAQPAEKKNNSLAVSGDIAPIIVIDICSLRQDHLSGFGYNRNTTPNLDAFVKESAVFENFWTEAGFCLPNFATLLTGTRPEIHKQVISTSGKAVLPDSLETLAEILKKQGYKTAGFSGSRFLVPGSYGLERGFDTFFDPFQVSKHDAMGSASFEEIFPLVKTWVADNKNDPFFLYVTVDDLHAPYNADDPKMFYPDYKGILDKILPDMNFDKFFNGEIMSDGNQNLGMSQTIKDIQGNVVTAAMLQRAVEEFKKDPNNLKYLIARYDAAVKRTDRLTGELFDELKKNGLWDKSTIIVTVHQGEQLGEHNLLGHSQGLYQSIVQVPLFIKYPGFSINEKFTGLTERIDIPATILDIASVLPAHKQFSGKSLLPLLKDKNALWEKPYIFASSKPTGFVKGKDSANPTIEERAVRNDRYKLIWYGYKSQPYELYDLKKDSEEKNNLVSSLPGVFNELKGQLDNYIRVNQ